MQVVKEANGYKHMQESTVHTDSTCPEGMNIPIAQRDTVLTNHVGAMQGLEFCGWCLATGQE